MQARAFDGLRYAVAITIHCSSVPTTKKGCFVCCYRFIVMIVVEKETTPASTLRNKNAHASTPKRARTDVQTNLDIILSSSAVMF